MNLRDLIENFLSGDEHLLTLVYWAILPIVALGVASKMLVDKIRRGK